MLGCLADGKLTLNELHRFSNEPVQIQGSLHWDVPRLFEELKVGLRRAAGQAVAGLSVDSWGVDYVLLNEHALLPGLPHAYRDRRTDATFAAVRQTAGDGLIFRETGIQFMPINTLYQLAADLRDQPEVVGLADRFLLIADYFNFLFSGVAKAEESLASTTQMYDPVRKTWSQPLRDVLGLPGRIFPEVVPAGTVLGPLAPALREEIGWGEGTTVVATCSHDTGAAVAAVPAEPGQDWAFLSSGTWSLIGVELAAPLINDEVRAHNYTNEAGYGGMTRFLKNIAGMWLLQECQRAWRQTGRVFAYDGLMEQAAAAAPFRSLVHPNAEGFARPADMPRALADYCRATGQPPPETPGECVRCVLESLALLYRQSLGELERLTGRTLRRLHIVGGGSQSALHNQFTADATGCTVWAGPVEATAAGNVLIQAITLGQVASLSQAREIVRAAFSIQQLDPADDATGEWQAARERFARLPLQP